MRAMNWVEPLLDKQHRCPDGIIGRMVGERMVRQHAPETAWTIALLEIKPTDHLLEIGFGAGKAIELAAAQATRGYVAGIDLSREMLRASQRRNAQAINAGRAQLRQGDVASLPFADQQFDKIFGIHTLYFWPDPAAAIAEIARVLKPGGLLTLTFSPGKVGEVSDTDYQAVVEAYFIPAMQHSGFTSTDLKEGPHSRQYRSAALIGVK